MLESGEGVIEDKSLSVCSLVLGCSVSNGGTILKGVVVAVHTTWHVGLFPAES